MFPRLMGQVLRYKYLHRYLGMTAVAPDLVRGPKLLAARTAARLTLHTVSAHSIARRTVFKICNGGKPAELTLPTSSLIGPPA